MGPNSLVCGLTQVPLLYLRSLSSHTQHHFEFGTIPIPDPQILSFSIASSGLSVYHRKFFKTVSFGFGVGD